MVILLFQPESQSIGIKDMSCYVWKRDVRLEMRTPGEFPDDLLHPMLPVPLWVLGPPSTAYPTIKKGGEEWWWWWAQSDWMKILVEVPLMGTGSKDVHSCWHGLSDVVTEETFMIGGHSSHLFTDTECL